MIKKCTPKSFLEVSMMDYVFVCHNDPLYINLLCWEATSYLLFTCKTTYNTMIKLLTKLPQKSKDLQQIENFFMIPK